LANVVFISEYNHQLKKNRDSGNFVFTKVKEVGNTIKKSMKE
jgi:hypothetical protein